VDFIIIFTLAARFFVWVNICSVDDILERRLLIDFGIYLRMLGGRFGLQCTHIGMLFGLV